jgi:hypothetical protein
LAAVFLVVVFVGADRVPVDQFAADLVVGRVVVDFLAVEVGAVLLLLLDWLAVDLLAVDFLAADFLAADFLAAEEPFVELRDGVLVLVVDRLGDVRAAVDFGRDPDDVDDSDEPEAPEGPAERRPGLLRVRRSDDELPEVREEPEPREDRDEMLVTLPSWISPGQPSSSSWCSRVCVATCRA